MRYRVDGMTNNLTEVKQGRIKLFIGWIVSHAVSIGLIGIGLALFLSSCSKASASSLPDNLEEILESDFENHSYDYSDYSSYFTDILSRDDLNVVRIRRSENDILYYFYMYYGMQIRTNYSNGYFPFWGFDTYLMNIASRGTTWDTTKVCYYALSITNSGVKLDAFKPHRSNYYDNLTLSLYSFPNYVPTNGDGANGTSLGISISACNMHADYKTIVFNSSNSTYNSLYGIYDSDSIICSSDFYYQGNGSTAFYKESNWDEYYPPAVDDERLKITTVNDIYGQKNLFIDIREFINDFPISDTSGSSNWLDNDTLIITLVRDYIPEEVRLNASNSTIKSKYIFETPYSFFNVSEDEDLYISDVSFSISGSGQSVPLQTESYNILCEYWLNEVYTRPSQDIIPIDGDVTGEVITNEEKQAKQYLVDFNQGYGLTFTEYQSLNKPDFFEDDAYFIYLSDGGNLADLINILFPNDEAHAIIEYIDNIDSEIKLQETIEDYLAHNAYTQMCSMIVFVFIEDWTDFTAGTISSDELTYYYYVTTYGRIKQVNQQLADIYISSKQLEKNTSATYSYLYEKLNDFENMTLEAIWGNNHFSIFTNLNKLDNDLLSSVSRIIDAMPTYTPYDDHDVIYELGILQGLLETIIENQDSPHDGYPKYIAWVKNFDDLDGFGNWSESVLNTFKNIYSFFNYRQDINVMETGLQTYVTYVDRYVDMLLGNSEEDLAIQSRYYLSIYDGTYDVHNINGGS